jgi:hypothetical protein
MGEQVWALHGLWLRTPVLELWVTAEADLDRVCVILPDDVEQDPSATRYAGLDERSSRSAVVAQR